jgi:twitching motility protein PilT
VAISSVIREKKTFQIPSLMQTARKDGMQLLDVHLMQLVKDGVVTAEDAYLHAAAKEPFAALIDKPRLAA